MSNKRGLPDLAQAVTSGCLLPAFLWLWIAVALAGIVTAVIALTKQPVDGNAIAPDWAYIATILVFGLYLISIIGILLEKEAGVSGFLLASVLLYGLNVLTGALPGESMGIFGGVVLLLFLLRLDEWQQPEAHLLSRGYREALDAEYLSPKAALKMYEKLGQVNRDVYPGMVLLGAITMPGAYLLAQWLIRRTSLNPDLIETVLLMVVGVGPLVWMMGRIHARRKHYHASYERSEEDRATKVIMGIGMIWGMVVILFAVLFNDLLVLVISAIVASLLALVLLQPYSLYLLITQGPPYQLIPDMPDVARYAISLPIFVLVLLIILAEVRLKPLSRTLPDLPVALKTNFEKLVSFLAGFVMLLAFSSIYVQSGPFALDIRSTVVLQALSGALLGYAYAEQKHLPALDVLTQIGQARCLRRTGKRLEGFYILFRLVDATKYDSEIPEAYQWLAKAMQESLEAHPDPEGVRYCIETARENTSPGLPYADLFMDALRRCDQTMRR